MDPKTLLYSADHEWVAHDEAAGTATLGVTDYAAQQLGDVVYIDLPEAGTALTAGEQFGEIESTKSVSDLVSPLSGEVTEVNDAAVDAPETVNSDAFGDAWLLRVTVSALGEGLMDHAAYRELIGE